jgi:hypothetical protein
MEKLTEQEVTELYGNVRLKFKSYYKYSFTFGAVASDGALITARYGGNSDGIYRYELDAEIEVVLGEDFKSNWHGVSIYREGEEVFDWSDY